MSPPPRVRRPPRFPSPPPCTSRTLGYYSTRVRCVSLARKVAVVRPRRPLPVADKALAACPRADAPPTCRYRVRPGVSYDTYPRPPYPKTANVTFVVVMPAMTKQAFQSERYRAIVHNAIVDLVKPAFAPRIFVHVRNAVTCPPPPPPRAVRRSPPPPPPPRRQCTVASARQGLVVRTVVQFDMIEREPIACFLRLFHSSRTGTFAAPHWLQNAYGRATGVHHVLADGVWLSAYRALLPPRSG